MNVVRLPQNDVTIARVGFGTASLMRLASGRARRALLDAAIDAGLTHFDVARMYGLGAVEGEVGRAIASRRDAVTIATKFGLDVSPKVQAVARFQGPARALLNRAAPLRSSVRGQREKFVAPRRYDAIGATRSIEISLKELGTDYVDFLFVHDPGPADEIYVEELRACFEALKHAGKIRAWGVSQDDHPTFSVVDRLGSTAVLQIRNTVFDEPVAAASPHIAFGVLGAPLERIRHQLVDPRVLQRWRDRLDTPDPGQRAAALLLASALNRNQHGAVLYSTLQPERLRDVSSILENLPSSSEVRAFEELISESSPKS